jgi:hypothetical protein
MGHFGRLLVGRLCPRRRDLVGGGGSTDRSQDNHGEVSADFEGQTRRQFFNGLEAAQVVVQLAGDVALEDPDDLLFGFAFFGSPLHIGAAPTWRTIAGQGALSMPNLGRVPHPRA